MDFTILCLERAITIRRILQTNLKVDKDNVIFVYGNGCLHAVSSIDGEVLWKEPIAEG